jgi:hypothetical protein
MRKGITVTVNASDRGRLEAVVANRNSPQKHVWRGRIVLLTAEGSRESSQTNLFHCDEKLDS